MKQIKSGRVFGLSVLAALSLMAVVAGGAQAGEFLVNGVSATKLSATGTGQLEGLGVLLVAGRNLTISCETGDVINAKLLSGTEGLGTVTFLECVTRNHKTGALLPCTVDQPTASAILLAKLHSGIPYITAKPDGGSTFTTVLLLGEICPLPEVNPVTGSVSAQVTTNQSVTDLISASEAFSTLVGDSLSFGGFKATISGTATGAMTGPHAGLKFGIG